MPCEHAYNLIKNRAKKRSCATLTWLPPRFSASHNSIGSESSYATLGILRCLATSPSIVLFQQGQAPQSTARICEQANDSGRLGPWLYVQKGFIFLALHFKEMSTVSSRIKSCANCRRHRLRCDRVRRAPSACTKCWQRGLQCVFEPVAHRKSASESNGSPTAMPQQTYDTDSHRATPPRIVTSEVSSHPFSVNENTTKQRFRLPAILDGALSALEQYAGPSLQAEGISLSPAQINEHFDYFFRYMHPTFPFMNHQISISKISHSSPLLFWTVITVANTYRDRSLYRTLQPFVRKLIAEILYPAGHGLESCQALCLICLWPLEAHDPNDDPYYLYAGLATHLALRQGLHRPEFPQEFKDINKTAARADEAYYERWSTWCACQFVERMLAGKTGVPSGVRQDWPTRLKLESSRDSGEPAIPQTMKNQLVICTIRDRHLNALAYDGHTLSGLAPPNTRISYLRLLNEALDDFEASAMGLDVLSMIHLQATRVTVSGFYLARDLQNDFAEECRRMMLGGLDSASNLLDIIAPLAWEILPVHILRAVLYAGVFAAQLEKLDFRLSTTVKPLAILERATDILRHLAYGSDFPTRAKIILEAELTRSYEGSGGDASSSAHVPTDYSSATADVGVGVKFQSRMGANMYWDLVESEKNKHNWNQKADDIYWELLVSGIYPSSS